MNVDIHGFHFLPPSIRVPPSWQPVHGGGVSGVPGSAEAIASGSTMMLHVAAVDHMLPLVFGQT